MQLNKIESWEVGRGEVGSDAMESKESKMFVEVNWRQVMLAVAP